MQCLLALPLALLPIFGILTETNILSTTATFTYLIVGTGLSLILIRIIGFSPKFEKEDFWGFLVFALLHFLISSVTLTHHSLWLDEVTQYLVSAGGDFLWASALQQQMPLTYLHSALSYQLFGFTEWAPRFFPLVWGSLASGAMFVSLRALLLPPALVWLGSLFFSTYPWLIRYSQEGRPISFAIFCSLLYFYFLSSYVTDLQKGKRSILSLLYVIISCLLFLSSTFLQPAVLIFTVLLVGKFIWRIKFADWVLIVGVTAFCALLCFPHWLDIFENSQIYLKSNNAGYSVKYSTFIKMWATSFESHSIALAGVFLVAIYCAFRNFQNFRSTLKQTQFLTPFLISLLFTSSIVGLFFIFIKWNFNARYSLSAIPILTMTSFVAFHQLVGQMTQKNTRSALLMLFSMLLAFNAYGNYKLVTSTDFDRGSDDLRSVFQKINETSKPGDVVLLIHSRPYEMWRPFGLFGSEFYHKAGNEIHIKYQTGLRFPTLIHQLLRQEITLQPQNIFFIHNWPKPVPSEKLDSTFQETFDGFIVSRLACGDVWLNCLARFKDKFKSIYPEEADQLSFVEMDVEILSFQGKCDDAHEKMLSLQRFQIEKYDPELFEYLSKQIENCRNRSI